MIHSHFIATPAYWSCRYRRLGLEMLTFLPFALLGYRIRYLTFNLDLSRVVLEFAISYLF